MSPNQQVTFTTRVKCNAAPSCAVTAKINDHTGEPLALFANSDFVAAQRDPKAAQLLQRDRFARTVQIHAVFHEMAVRLIADIEAQEAGWPEFDRSYAQRLHKPFVG